MVTLETKIEGVPRISRKIIPALKRLGIKTIRDLLFYFPSRYEDFSNQKQISDITVGEVVTVRGAIKKIANRRTARKHMDLTEAAVEDETGTVKVLWFNQPFLARTLRQGNAVSLSGKVALGPGGPYLQNPAYEKIGNWKLEIGNSQPIHTGGLVSIYPETAGISSRWIRFLVKTFIELRRELVDPLPVELRRTNGLIELKIALQHIHFPGNQEEAAEAERRFIFEELFLVQLRALRDRLRLKQHRAPEIPFDAALVKKFVSFLPFRLTDAQRRSMWEIFQDIARPRPMNRLLEGDVGSGKTVVAAAAALLTHSAGYRTAFMAPTEILARQHYATLKQMLSPFQVNIGLLIGAEKRGGKDTDVFIGTHALIQKNVKFNNLGLVVVDEQHRFGVQQRAELVARGRDAESMRTNAENQYAHQKLLYEDLTYAIRGTAFKVRKQLGLGHKESVYQEAFAEELRMRGVAFEKEKHLNIEYGGRKIGTYQPDFVIDDKVIVELKALPYVGEAHQKQLWSYLKGSSYKLALLINFGGRTLEVRRLIYDSSRGQRSSASGPRESAFVPHFLSMTATPIPRTLALTVYGDLDLSILDEMPPTRKPVITKVVEPWKRVEAYEFIRRKVNDGQQVFVICPRIEIPSTNNQVPNKSQILNHKLQTRLWFAETKAVKEEYRKLKDEIFNDLRVGMLHGKMKSKEKDAVMQKFRNREFDILVSTSVVEVGVDVPNATIMMIEGAERFGLAQLHQFRGRVGRGEEQSYCFLFPTEDGMATRRLRAVVEAKNGFELAEQDLKIRGPGDIFGTRQWGVPDIVLKGITDPELVRTVRHEAVELLKKDPTLANHTQLRKKLEEREKIVHLE